MIDLERWLLELDDGEEQEAKRQHESNEALFEQYVLRKDTSYRRELLKQYRDGEALTGKDGLRKKLAAVDLAYFGRAYLPHYFVRESPEFHGELDDIWAEGVLKNKNPYTDAAQINRMDGSNWAIAAPRGHAKSTTFTFKDSLHAALYAYKHYILILSDSTEQAEAFLEDIKTELEDNAYIIEDFGHLKGDSTWKTGTIKATNGVKIDAIGSGKKIRGRKNRSWRPDLIVLDDIENDENVATPEQRRKLKSWFDKAVLKAGDTYTDVMYVGTILHYDSLLAGKLQNPGFKSRKYRAVIADSAHLELWEAWEKIYTNLFNNQHEADAEAFFEANREEMLEGTEVLWEAKLSYYKLMKMKVDEGTASFNSELQNDPIDPDNADFNEEWFVYYEDGEVDFKQPKFLFIGGNDPSLGKNAKADTSSIITLALDTESGYKYVVYADIAKRNPDKIIEDIFDTDKRLRLEYGKGYYSFGVEDVQFQYYFKQVMAQKSAEQGVYLPIEGITSTSNKVLRIRSLQPEVKNGYIRFQRRQKTLLQQMQEFPMGKNDDGPDGLHMAVLMANKVKAAGHQIGYKSVGKRLLRWKKGAY
ncbi:hypothetical protein D7Y05_08135 [bacterium 1XD42-54]|nr:hypothetical protein D7Y05_08135 [bacterium 1XD42-54]